MLFSDIKLNDIYHLLCVCLVAGYPPFLPQMPAHVGLPPELCPRELLPLSAAAAAALGSISPGASLPYASRPSLVSDDDLTLPSGSGISSQMLRI